MEDGNVEYPECFTRVGDLLDGKAGDLLEEDFRGNIPEIQNLLLLSLNEGYLDKAVDDYFSIHEKNPILITQDEKDNPDAVSLKLMDVEEAYIRCLKNLPSETRDKYENILQKELSEEVRGTKVGDFNKNKDLVGLFYKCCILRNIQEEKENN